MWNCSFSSLRQPALDDVPLVAVLLVAAVGFACGEARPAVTREEIGGTIAPTVISLRWRNQEVGIGSDRLTTFCCHNPIGYTCIVDAPDTPSVTVSLSFQDLRGACATRENCWVETRALSTTSGSRVTLSVVKEAPLTFTPSILVCSAANSRGYVGPPLTIAMDVPKGIGP